MPQTGTQTCTDQQNKHRFIAFSAGSKRMPKAAAAADDRVGGWRVRRREQAAAAEEEGPETNAEEPVEEICFCGTDRHELDNAYSFEGAWVQCDECERWCHGECAGLSLEEAEAIESYVCPVCRPNGVAGGGARVQAAARRRRQARAVWVRRDGAGLRCDGGCGRGIKRGGWWACGGCDYDVCTSCYEEEVGAVGA